MSRISQNAHNCHAFRCDMLIHPAAAVGRHDGPTEPYPCKLLRQRTAGAQRRESDVKVRVTFSFSVREEVCPIRLAFWPARKLHPRLRPSYRCPVRRCSDVQIIGLRETCYEGRLANCGRHRQADNTDVPAAQRRPRQGPAGTGASRSCPHNKRHKSKLAQLRFVALGIPKHVR